MSNVIMDASAILAFLNQESGSEQITDLIENATISTINLSEVIAKLAEIGILETEILQILSDLNLKIVPFDEPQAQIAGMLRPMTKPLGLIPWRSRLFSPGSCSQSTRDHRRPPMESVKS